MSHKYSVLADHPIALYRSNSVTGLTMASYQELLETYSSYQQLESAFPNYALSSGNQILDESGCGNYAIYTGNIETSYLPLVYGETYAIKIDNDSYLDLNTKRGYGRELNKGSFGDKYSSDNEFTLETWFFQKFTDISKKTLIADPISNIGIFYENGDIIFSLGSQSIRYTLPILNKAYFVAASYSPSLASLYVDGIQVSAIQLSNFKYTNDSLSLKVGPTNIGEYFLINGMAVYRYALTSQQIYKHFMSGQPIQAQEIAYPDNGRLFEINDNNTRKSFSYSYPANKSFDKIAVDGLSYNEKTKRIKITHTDTPAEVSIEMNDFLYIPESIQFTSSKIEWHGENGISVFISQNGIDYIECSNRSPLPGYEYSNFSNNKKIYLKIVMHSPDTSIINPELEYLIIKFYQEQKEYSVNTTDYITKATNINNLISYDNYIGNYRYPILSRDPRNGITTMPGSGFYINTKANINSIEMFYSPKSLLSSSLINGYSWNDSGLINNTAVDKIYINGIDLSSETNINNLFVTGELYHVIIVLTQPESGAVLFGGLPSGSGCGQYQNICLYQSAMTQQLVSKHYKLYATSDITYIDDSVNGMTENSVSYYNNDWKTVQTA